MPSIEYEKMNGRGGYWLEKCRILLERNRLQKKVIKTLVNYLAQSMIINKDNKAYDELYLEIWGYIFVQTDLQKLIEDK